MTTRGPLRWFKLYAHQTIHGTTTKELDPAERWCWIGYLCLAASSPIPGTVCIANGLPYSTAQLCQLLAVSPAILKRATEKMIAVDKISVNGTGIHITNWSRYQGDYVRQQNRRARVTNVTPPLTVTNVTDREEEEEEEEKEKRKRKRSTAADAGTTCSVTPETFAAFASIYENNIGTLGPIVADELAELAALYPLEWFEKAVQEAVKANARSLRYVIAILERWGRDGGPSRPVPSVGHPPGRRPKSPLPGAAELKQGWDQHASP